MKWVLINYRLATQPGFREKIGNHKKIHAHDTEPSG